MAEFYGVIGELVRTGMAQATKDYQGVQAEKYDLVQSWTGDVGYYVQWAKRQGAPVLELACGTGRVGLAIVEAGVDYTGLDLSPDMLSVFRHKLQEAGVIPGSVGLVLGDMTDFSLDRKYSLIIVPCYSFTHLVQGEQRSRLFNLCYNHLSRGGVLVMEMPLWVKNEEWTGNQPRYSFHRIRGGSQVLSFYQTRPEQPGLVTLNFLNIFPADSGTARLEAVACTEYRATPPELMALASKAGFTETNLYRDYRENPLQEGDHAAVLVARKDGCR